MKKSSKKMFWLSGLCCIGWVGAIGSVSAQAEATVEVRGVRIVGEGEGEDFMDSVRPFNWNKGTTLAILIKKEDGGIIDVDTDASEVTLFEDDLGTDLLEAPEEDDIAFFSGQGGFESFPDIKADGTAAMVELSGELLPAKGAKTLKAQGEIVLLVASNKEKFTQTLELKVGSKVTVGPVPMEITQVGEPEWGDAALAVTFTAKEYLDAIAGISFSADEEEIETSGGGESSMAMFDSVTVERTINFEKKVDSAEIIIEAWKDMNRVSIPLDVTTGLGL